MSKRKVFLYGSLKQYGPVIEMNINAPIDAFRALFANYSEARKVVGDGAFKIVVGDKKRGRQLGEDELGFQGSKDIHIIPVVKGRGGRGGGKIIAGVGIIALAYLAAPAVVGALGPTQGMGATAFSVFGSSVTYGNIAMIGAAMALGGTASMLAGTPSAASYESRESPDQRSSFLYNGPVNTVEQGAAIPLVYGRMRTGSVLVSAGLSVEQI